MSDQAPDGMTEDGVPVYTEQVVVGSPWPGTVSFCVLMLCLTAIALDFIP